jgi:hypothetical protein
MALRNPVDANGMHVNAVTVAQVPGASSVPRLIVTRGNIEAEAALTAIKRTETQYARIQKVSGEEIKSSKAQLASAE